MATADHVRDFLSPLEDDPVVALRDAFVEAGSKDPALAKALLAIGQEMGKHSLSPRVAKEGPRIGGLSPQVTPVFTVGYMRARQALLSGHGVGDFAAAADKALKAMKRLEPDFGAQLAFAVDNRMAKSPTFRRRIFSAAAEAEAGIGFSKEADKQVIAMRQNTGGGSGDDSWCTICVNGSCRPGSNAECWLGIVIIIIIVVTK